MPTHSGWFATQWRAVLAKFYRLDDIVQSDSAAAAAAAARVDIAWRAIEALVRILDTPTHRDAAERPSVREPPAR